MLGFTTGDLRALERLAAKQDPETAKWFENLKANHWEEFVKMVKQYIKDCPGMKALRGGAAKGTGKGKSKKADSRFRGTFPMVVYKEAMISRTTVQTLVQKKLMTENMCPCESENQSQRKASCIDREA